MEKETTMTQTQMTLPNGDTLHDGDCGVTRDGLKTKPIKFNGGVQWSDGDGSWNNEGIAYNYNLDDDDIIAKWVDTDAPTLWRDMTPEQKGALLLDHHEGKEIEYYAFTYNEWEIVADGLPNWGECEAYRVKPEVEPKKPREWWIAFYSGYVIDVVYEKPNDMYGYIHVREVIK